MKINVAVNALVSVPDRVIFPGRRDPYEWENGIVIGHGKNKNGIELAKVLVYNHLTKKSYEKWFIQSLLKKPQYYHMVDEENIFMAWVQDQKGA